MIAPTSTDQRGGSAGRLPAARGLRFSWPTVLAFAVLAIPFGIILVRLVLAGGRVYLPDDLALIDLHTRQALQWRQELGPFDRFGWNHPGPSLFYLLAIPSRLFGSGARAEFLGATLINALASIGSVWVVRRRDGPMPALWAAICVGGLAFQLSFVGPSSITYSESVLGILASPWNATVIILPLVLFAVLCAAAPARSPLSLVGALLVGTFIVQSDISTTPLVAGLLGASVVACAAGAVWDRRARKMADADADGVPTAEAVPAASREDGPAPGWASRARWWGVAGLAVLVVMWLPPIIEQMTTHPGNLDLIYRFFTTPPSTAPVSSPLQATARITDLHAALLSMIAVDGILLLGTSEVMTGALGGTPHHAGIVVVTFVGIVLIGAGVTVGGIRWRNRFGACLGAFSLVGLVATMVGATRLEGFVFGYLVAWEVAAPLLALVGVGVVVHGRWGRYARASGRSARGWTATRLGLGGVALGVCALLSFRMVALPPLSAVSDPTVGQVVSLVTSRVGPGDGPVSVGSTGLDLIQVEELVGAVDQLDRDGYQPRVGSALAHPFGPGFLSTGREPIRVDLARWSTTSPRLLGYVGRAGDIAVTVTGRAG